MGKVPLHIGDQVCFTDLLVALIAASFERSAASSNLSGLSFEIDVIYDRYNKLPLATARSWEHILHSYNENVDPERNESNPQGHVDFASHDDDDESEAETPDHRDLSFTSSIKAVFAGVRGHRPVNVDDDDDDEEDATNDHGDWSPPECRRYLKKIRHTTDSPGHHPMENIVFDGKLLTVFDQIMTVGHYRCITLVQRAVRRKLRAGKDMATAITGILKKK